jgi:CoA:oxalate CoA-transferase
MDRPLLAGMRVLDLSDLKGQLCGRLLRDLGMEVIKVEPPGGDMVRRLEPFARDEPHLEGSLRFAYLNAGKLSLTLDFGRPAGRELLLRLVEQSDVLLESFGPGELACVGLGPDELRTRNPGLVITSITGFGQTGPKRDMPCPDLVGLALGGLLYVSGDPSLPPVKAPETQSFYFACVYAALATLLALWQRSRDNRGRSADISIQEGVASQEHLIRAAGFDGETIRRHGSQHEFVAPANIFPAQDGWVYLFVSQQHWRAFLSLWRDHPAELDARKYESNSVRKAKCDWLNQVIGQFTRQFTKEAFVRLMQERGIPCLPVNSLSDFANDEQLRFRGLFQPTRHATLGGYQQIAFPVLIDGARTPGLPPPLLGQHTHAILTERLGLSQCEVSVLFAQRVI